MAWFLDASYEAATQTVWVNVKWNDGTWIVVDGSNFEYAPSAGVHHLKLPPGGHDLWLNCSRPDCPVKVHVDVPAPVVVPTTGIIQISATPNASVYVDDVGKGVTPINVTVPAGAHTVKILASAYNDFIQTVNVVAGGIANVNATLTLKPVAPAPAPATTTTTKPPGTWDTNPCTGTPDGEYTFGTCKGGVLISGQPLPPPPTPSETFYLSYLGYNIYQAGSQFHLYDPSGTSLGFYTTIDAAKSGAEGNNTISYNGYLIFKNAQGMYMVTSPLGASLGGYDTLDKAKARVDEAVKATNALNGIPAAPPTSPPAAPSTTPPAAPAGCPEGTTRTVKCPKNGKDITQKCVNGTWVNVDEKACNDNTLQALELVVIITVVIVLLAILAGRKK